jgi:hypothetical protein
MNQMTMYLIAIGFESVAILILWLRQLSHRAAIQNLYKVVNVLGMSQEFLSKEYDKLTKESERESSNA